MHTAYDWSQVGDGRRSSLPAASPSLLAVVNLVAWKMAMGVFCIRESSSC